MDENQGPSPKASQGEPKAAEALPLAAAATLVGVSVEALRQRVKRGTLPQVEAEGRGGRKVAAIPVEALREAYPDSFGDENQGPSPKASQGRDAREDPAGQAATTALAEVEHLRSELVRQERELRTLARALGTAEATALQLKGPDRRRWIERGTAAAAVAVIAAAALFSWSGSESAVEAAELQRDASAAALAQAQESALQARSESLDERETRIAAEAALSVERSARAAAVLERDQLAAELQAARHREAARAALRLLWSACF